MRSPRLASSLASSLAIAAALAAAGCNRTPAADNTTTQAQAQFALPELPATLPLEAGPAKPPAPAPSASDLPQAPPLKLARVADPDQAYGYADAATSYDEALGDAPPDYGFDYEGADPVAWQGYDDSLMVAEPIDDGYRHYYYRPGAAEPYFVRDPYYSYGFANGLLGVVYGADGGIVPYTDYGPRLAYASRYYARGRQLWRASRRTARRPVIAASWARQRPMILAARQRWDEGRAHQPAWQHYYEANHPRQVRYWQAEQVRRQADARRFDGWRATGFRTPPPPRAIPVAWQGAKWAHDERRYRPAAEALRADRGLPQRQEPALRDRPDRARPSAFPPSQPDQPRDRPQAPLIERQQQQAQRQAEQAARQRAQQEQHQQAQQVGRPQPQREQAQQQRQAQQAERQQAQQQQRQAQQAERQAQQAERQRAEQARRQQAGQAQRQAEQAQRQQAGQAQRQAQQAERQRAQQAERQQAQQAQREAGQAQRQQAAQAQRQAAQAERQQAVQIQRQTAQAERQQAAQAERQQAAQAQRQAEQAQRQQAAQAQRQAAQAERQQAQQAQRQQQAQPRSQPQPAQPQRPPRRDRPDAPGPN